MLERIAKLLNQAENAANEAEAAAFMEKAQQLATTYSVDLAKARHVTKSKERTLPEQRTVVIGERGTKGCAPWSTCTWVSLPPMTSPAPLPVPPPVSMRWGLPKTSTWPKRCMPRW